MLTVAPRMVNDVSNVMCINHEMHFAEDAHYPKNLCGSLGRATELTKE